MQISDEELIAYLLGDADQELRQRIDTQIPIDPDLVQRITELRLVLGHLDSLQTQFTPPPDLVASTLARCDASMDDACAEQGEEQTLQSDAKPSALPCLSAATRLASEAGPRSRLTMDSGALAICVAVLLSLFLPTVLRARYEARRIQCSHNLGTLGQDLIVYANHDPQRRYPSLDTDGPESFAGIYAVRLSDAGLLDSPTVLQCASLQGCRPFEEERDEFRFVPRLAELRAMDSASWERCRRLVGGDYAYNLGISRNGRNVIAPRQEGRTHFALMADYPLTAGPSKQLLVHDGRGLNILFDDGHVAFIDLSRWSEAVGDHPFFNLKQVREVGLSEQDASLGPSCFGPFDNDARVRLIAN